MAKVLSIADSARFHMSPKVWKHEAVRIVPANPTVEPNPWDRVARAISSPMAIVGYFILVLMGCSHLH